MATIPGNHLGTHAANHMLKKRGIWQQILFYLRRDWAYYILLIPAILYFVIFRYVPMYGVVIAFKDFGIFKGVWDSDWVGLENFTTLFTSLDFGNVMRNTILISVYKLVFGFPAPIILAIMLNEVRLKFFKSTVQTITYLPHFLSWVILGGILANVLIPSSGLLGIIFRSVGLEPPVILGSPDWFRPLLVISDIWKEVGWSSIIYLAALTALNPELSEAAAIDGAGYWQRLWNITLPGISGTIAVVLILRLGVILDAGFEQTFVLLQPTTYDVGDILDTYVYRIGLAQRQYSLAAAAGLFKSAIGLVLMVVTNTWAKKLGGKGIW